MTWGKRLIIALGLMLLTHVAHALRIEKFTDSQGTLHITNGPKKPENLVNQPSPGASHLPSRLRGIPMVAPPTKDLKPKAQVPEPEPQPEPEPETQIEPEPGMVPTEPVPVDPQPGTRLTDPEVSVRVTQVTDRIREKKDRERAADEFFNQVTGTAARDAAREMARQVPHTAGLTLGGDKNYDTPN